MYYLCSENKGADQLRGYRKSDLRLFFFLHMQKSGFLMTRINKCLLINLMGFLYKFSDMKYCHILCLKYYLV